MTREEAKGNLIHAISWNDMPKKEALEMAIKALDQAPCEDAIRRQEVLDIVDSYSESQSNVEDVTQDIISDIVALPSVNPQPKTGHWIFDEILDRHYYCSECKSMGVDYWDYCPNCGAKMEEVEE